MIQLGDVPVLLDSARLVLPVYSRAAVRGLRRVALRRSVSSAKIPTQYRRNTDMIPTRRFDRRGTP